MRFLKKKNKQSKSITIDVKQLGFAKFVYVRTRGNGGVGKL